MIYRGLFALFVFAATSLSCATSFAEQKAPPTKLEEVRELCDQLTKSQFGSHRPSLGVLSQWECSLNSFQDKIEPKVLHELCARFVKRFGVLYGDEVKTYLSKDRFGFPTQIWVVNFTDHDLGESRLVIGIYQGNDSTGFYFLHLKGHFKSVASWSPKKDLGLDPAFTNLE